LHCQKKKQDYLLFLLVVVRVVLRLAAVFFLDFVAFFLVGDFLAAAFVQDDAHSVVIPTDVANFLHA
jgi:hypothetical protein